MAVVMIINTVMLYHPLMFSITVKRDFVFMIFAVPTCDPPRLSDNADFRVPSQKRKRSFNYQEKVLLKCRTGYYQNGMLGLLTCGPKGQWTSSSFTCSRKLKKKTKTKATTDIRVTWTSL